MLNNTAGIKFKYADDSQILVITDNQGGGKLEPNMADLAEWHQDRNRDHQIRREYTYVQSERRKLQNKL